MGVIVACFGNVLRGDDGFGVAVAERLQETGVPPGVDVVDVGIGGIHLVHELLGVAGSVGGLVIVDAVDLGRPAGTVVVIEPEVPDVGRLSPAQRRDALADMHYATPARALMLASALGALPARTLLVGCQPVDADRLGQGLSPAVARVVGLAAGEVRRVVSGFGIPWR